MKEEKVGKGFELFYDKLSYRRKFIRTLWMIPIGIFVGIIIAYIGIGFVTAVYWIWFLMVGWKQLKYNYKMQKQEMIR